MLSTSVQIQRVQTSKDKQRLGDITETEGQRNLQSEVTEILCSVEDNVIREIYKVYNGRIR